MKFVIRENMTSQPAASFYTKHLCPVLLYFLFLFQDKALPAKKRAVSQPARVSTRAKRARNDNPSSQNSTPALPVAPPQWPIQDTEEVPPFPAVSTGPEKRPAQTTVTQPSLDIAQLRSTITASVLQNLQAAGAIPQPTTPNTNVVTVEAPQILPSTCLVVQQEISDITEGDQTTLQVPLRKPFQIVAIHLESRVLLLTNNEDLKYAVSVSSEQDLGQAKLCLEPVHKPKRNATVN